MRSTQTIFGRGLFLAATLTAGSMALAQAADSGIPLTASRSEAATPVAPATTVAAEHPLASSVELAKQMLQKIDTINDYSCTLIKKERIDGKLGDHEYLFVKVRHQPFSVYTYFLGPKDLKGQEALYVAGRNGGNLLGHPTGLKHRLVGTVSLAPTSSLAMQNNRYPITDIGMKRLIERLIEYGEADMKYEECEVQTTPGAKINGRSATMIEIVHPHPRQHFRYHIARVYIDDEYQLPIRFEAYGWPGRSGGTPPLVEEYTYTNLKFNQSFKDVDFDARNPNYGFE